MAAVEEHSKVVEAMRRIRVRVEDNNLSTEKRDHRVQVNSCDITKFSFFLKSLVPHP